MYEQLVEREKKCKAAEASVSAALQQREQALDRRQKQVGKAANPGELRRQLSLGARIASLPLSASRHQ